MSPELSLYIVWGLWAASWWAAAFWSGPTAARMPWRQQFLYRALLVLGIALLFGFYMPRRMSPIRLWQLPENGLWVCTALVAAGLAFCWWARLHLGRLWSAHVMRKEGHHIIDTGPYGLVRHPIYTGIIFASLATVAQKGTIPAIAGVVLMTISWYIKARLEEMFLCEQLGVEAYDAYARRTPMLIPFLKF